MSSGPYFETVTTGPLQRMPLIPLGGPDGKRPLVKNWHRPSVLRAVARQRQSSFSTANVGLLTGRTSRLTVVDIDDDDKVDEVFRLLGQSALTVDTPNGLHAYFSFAGEISENALIPGVDIRGEHGFVVIPPSVRPSGDPANPSTSGQYRLRKAEWDAIFDCRPIPQGGLDLLRARYPVDSPVVDRVGQLSGSGALQDALWRYAMSVATTVSDVEELVDLVSAKALDLGNAISGAEATKVAARALLMTEQGRNYFAGDRNPIHVAGEIMRVAPDAALLYVGLRNAHGNTSKPFAIACRAMAEAEVLKGWKEGRIRKARNTLIDFGFLRCVHYGGRGKGDPSQFIWTPFGLRRE